MATRVLMLRHGETSEPDVFHGAESDVGLSERGHRQAEAAAAVLPAYQPVCVISSAMRRARETAAPIVHACAVPLHIEPGLHERAVGALSGTPTHHRDGVWPDTLARWLSGETGYAPPGAESYDAIRGRVLPIWERLTTTYSQRTFVMVAHGVVCKVLLLNVLPGLTLADWTKIGPIRNVGIHELIRETDTWHPVRLNEVPAAPTPCNKSS